MFVNIELFAKGESKKRRGLRESGATILPVLSNENVSPMNRADSKRVRGTLEIDKDHA